VTAWETVATIAGLAAITLLTRGFFLLPDREVPLPEWLRQGLRYAPLAAMTAIVVPDLLLVDGRLLATWRDARLFGAAAAVAYYYARRGILGTILAGTGTMLLLRLLLGW